MVEILWQSTPKDICEIFWRMSCAEAEIFFHEYLGQSNARINLLRNSFSESGGGSSRELDFGAESLIPLWRWAKSHLGTRSFSDTELSAINQLPDWAAKENLESAPLSEDTLRLVNDIAYYFAEVCIRNLPNVQWGICRTGIARLLDENQPVLKGFSPHLNPRQLVSVIVQRHLANKSTDEVLNESFRKWEGNLAVADKDNPTD